MESRVLKGLHWAVEADEIGITSLRPLFKAESVAENNNPFGVRDWIECYMHGENPDFTPPLHLMGTPFQLRVWELLMQIPYGETTTYGKIASLFYSSHFGTKRMSAQAVGQAVGRNPVALIVPCHRVVGAGGKLTGYAYGLPLKKALLELEKKG